MVMENFCVPINTRASRNGSDQQEMKGRIATQLFGVATIGSNKKGLSSDLRICDRRERVLKRKKNSRYAGFTSNVVTAPCKGKVFSGVNQKDAQRLLGYPKDYLAPLTTRKK
ncbi:MAG TPA: hypothetical protein DIT04_14360 [Dysgonomonas sp.]|nr:hypothetical protein [Dysgonomonas sp.]